jgi:hypothetical protein
MKPERSAQFLLGSCALTVLGAYLRQGDPGTDIIGMRGKE